MYDCGQSLNPAVDMGQVATDTESLQFHVDSDSYDYVWFLICCKMLFVAD